MRAAAAQGGDQRPMPSPDGGAIMVIGCSCPGHHLAATAMRMHRLAIVCARCSTKHFLETAGADVELLSMTIRCQGCGEELVVSGSQTPVMKVAFPSAAHPTTPEPDWYRHIEQG